MQNWQRDTGAQCPSDCGEVGMTYDNGLLICSIRGMRFEIAGNI